MSIILGINSHHPGSSAALLIDGVPVAAIAEERLNRRKYFAHFPVEAVRECLRIGGVRPSDIDVIAVGRDARANLAQKIRFAMARPEGLLNFARIRSRRLALDDLPALVAEACDVDPSTVRAEQINVEHHLAHIASAYFASGWDESAGFSVDGSGDFVTSMLARCEGNRIHVHQRVYVPRSLGSVYTMVSQFIGFGSYGDEGKVMGLAAYGSDRYREFFDRLVSLRHGDIALDSRYFLPFGRTQGIQINEQGEASIDRHYSDAMVEMFGPARDPNEELSQRDMDLAFGVQAAFERVYLGLLKQLHAAAPSDRVSIAGGCALNSVANGMIFGATPFARTAIQPAAGDEGLALGAALYAAHAVRDEPRRWEMSHSYLGPSFSDEEIRAALDSSGVAYEQFQRRPLLETTVSALEQGWVVGWFQGQMEWGPRALGNRSILAHPGLATMKDTLNARIKRREWFRPFAPAVLAERQAEIFEGTHPSPFMLHVYGIRPEWRERLSTVTHVDNTGRLQSVARHENPLYYDLIAAFGDRTGIPVLVNTSFNENEPIVCRPEQAIDCYRRTKMDMLVIGSFVCRKPDAGKSS